MLKKFSPKDPEEVVLIAFDFSELIPDTTETIQTIIWEVVSQNTVLDNNPTAILTAGTSAINSRLCLHMVQDGINGCSYIISCLVDTSKGQSLKMSGTMLVKSQNL
jgi:hypothetical protein